MSSLETQHTEHRHGSTSSPLTVIQLFEAQAAKTPHRIAISYDNQCLTYRELNIRANQLARIIRKSYRHMMGTEIRGDVICGLCMTKSLDIIVGILGILKAGAAYLPLDPTYPAERNKFILHDAGVTILVTQQILLRKNDFNFLKAPHKTYTLICIDAKDYQEMARRMPEENPNIINTERDLAYVIYTSGTSGNPKGVLIEHRSLLYSTTARMTVYKQRPQKFLLISPVIFDSSIAGIFWTLLSGGCLVIPPASFIENITYLIEVIAQEKITHLLCVPSYYHLLLQHMHDSKRFRAIQVIIVAGEICSPFLLSNHHQSGLRAILYNEYGPTENTVWSTYACLHEKNIPTIGKPLPHVKVYILDEQRRPVKKGSIGELYLGGLGLARGYLNLPALTKERFIEHLLGENRLYKTGDLVRCLPDDNLAFMGRIDEQIKIRGFRIEPAEIESILLNHADIQQAAVVVSDAWGHNLVAYYTEKTKNSPLSQIALKDYLTQKLPDYMVPVALIQLPQMPLTFSGKIDKKALLSLKPEKTNPALKMLHHENPLQAQLMAIWKKVLGINEIDAENNFFELGGNSLVAMRLLPLLEEAFHTSLSIRHVFEYPTITEFILFLQKRKTSMADQFLPLIQPDLDNRYAPFPLTAVQHAYWLGSQHLYALGDVSTRFYSEMDFRPALNISRLEKALNALIIRHDMLRAIINSDATQQILPAVPYYCFLIQDLRTSPTHESNQRLLAWRDQLSHGVFNTTQFPLFDFRLSHLPDRYRLHISTDALIFDGMSFQQFFSEWENIYRNINLPRPLPDITFRDYVMMDNRIKQTERYRQDRDYWLNRLDSFPTGPELPLAKQPEEIKKTHFVRCTLTLHKEIWQAFKNKAQTYKLSPTSVLLTLYGQVLARYSKNSHFLINLTLFNRLPLHPKIDQIMGDFTSLSLLEYGASTQEETKENFLTRVQALQNLLWHDLDHKLFNAIEAQRSLSKKNQKSLGVHAPVVFTSMLNFKNSLEESFLSQELIETVYTITQTPQVWIDNKVFERHGGLIVEWDYVAELFPDHMIADMHRGYCELILFLAEANHWAIPLPDILSSKTLDLIHHNHSPQTTQTPLDLYEMFDRQVNTHKTENAIISTQGSWSYNDLWCVANFIADRIITLIGMNPRPIAVLLDKGWEQVAACLGILSAGAAYIPCSIDWPSARIAAVLKSAAAHTLITLPDVIEKLQSTGFDSTLYNLVFVEKKIRAVRDLSRKTMFDKLAYIIFTSGSTDTPKGVMITHRSAANTIHDVNDRFKICDSDKLLALSSLSFDLSVYDIFGMLAAGGSIVFPDRDKIKEPFHWLELLETHKITIWNTVPMLMQMLVDYIEDIIPIAQQPAHQHYNTLRLILLSGDWIPLTLPEKIKVIFPNAQIISLGGATETSIWSVLYPIQHIDKTWKSIPYGKAMRNQKIYVLNTHLEYCPEHIEGDIYIAGEGLAIGYLDDPAQTNSHFIWHPKTGERLYRASDKGRLLPSGDIEFLGREDTQVKIGGYRIELGEIEKALTALPPIKYAMVDVHGERFSNKKMVAYLLPYESAADKLSSAEKLAFKSAQHNIKTEGLCATPISLLSPPMQEEIIRHYFARKSYRQFIKQKISYVSLRACLEAASSWCEPKPKNTDNFLDRLSFVLTGLRSYKNEHTILPKYHYPSAGSLYPVQVYIEHYYYNPSMHTLTAIDNRQDHISLHSFIDLQLHFVSALEAITPLYEEYSMAFCELEVGYMIALIAARAKQLGYRITPLINPTQTHDLNLSPHDHYHITVKFSSTKTIKENPFVFAPHVAIKILIYIKPHAVDQLSAGLYQWRDNQLLYQENWQPQNENFDQLGANGAILSDAQCIIFFFGTENASSHYFIGEYTQRMMDSCIAHHIGCCAIGYLVNNHELDQYTSGDKLLHTIAIGTVSQTDIESQHYIEANIDAHPETSLPLYVKTKLKQKLPDYMIPDIYFKISDLPLTANGKVDRKKIKAEHPLHASLQTKICHAAPRNVIEFRLLKLWQDCLNVQSIHIHDNFFEAGGDSLLATRLAGHINRAFKTKHPIAWIFQHNTITQQASALQEKTEAGDLYQPIIEFKRGRKEKTPLVFVHSGLSGAETYAEFARLLQDDYPFYAIDSYNLNSGKNALHSVSELASTYVQYLQKILPKGPYHLGGFCVGGVIAFEMAQQLLAKGENVRNLYLLNSIQTPSRLADMRAQLPHSLERLMNDLSDEVTSYVKQLSPKEQAHWVACANTDEYLLTSYQAKKIRIPVIFLKAQQDYPEDKTNSWDHVADHFISISINTDHAGMMKHPTLEKIAHIVNHYLTNDAWHRV